jgi:hypothetical protein
MISGKLFFTEPFKVEIREEPLPSPVDDQILIQTTLSAISAGTELLFYTGRQPSDMKLDGSIPSLPGLAGYPVSYGYSLAGRIVEAGPGVRADWKPGSPRRGAFTVRFQFQVLRRLLVRNKNTPSFTGRRLSQEQDQPVFKPGKHHRPRILGQVVKIPSCQRGVAQAWRHGTQPADNAPDSFQPMLIRIYYDA